VKFWLPTWPWNQVRKLALLDCFEEEEEQQQPVSAEVAITNNGQRNQPSCLCSHSQRKGTVHQMWACAWCFVLRNTTQK